MISEEMIPIIERSFGFELYEWQKQYILGKINCRIGGRRNGNTFAYCLRLLLSDGEPISKKELCKYIDEAHDIHYRRWFAQYCAEIDYILKKSGLKTRMID